MRGLEKGGRMRAVLWAAVVAVTGAVIVFLAVRRLSGKLEEVRIPSETLQGVDAILWRFSDTCFLQLERGQDGRWRGMAGRSVFEPDAARIDDFLSVFNEWEIAIVPADSQQKAWKEAIDGHGGEILLKAGRRHVFRASFVDEGGCFVIRRSPRRVYAMTVSYRPDSWHDFFEPDPGLWRNRLLFDFDYTGLASVSVLRPGTEGSYRLRRQGDTYLLASSAGVDTIAAGRAQAYLSSFGRVYFDSRDGQEEAGDFLCALEICPGRGDCVSFKVFEKKTAEGTDIFKALVERRHGGGTDTVELPYVVLDKLVKEAGWFKGR